MSERTSLSQAAGLAAWLAATFAAAATIRADLVGMAEQSGGLAVSSSTGT